MNETAIRVLIVEDNLETINTIRSICEPEDAIEIIGDAPTGERGIRLYNQFVPDVVVIDLHMEPMDGPTTIRLLRNHYLDAKVIVLTQLNERDKNYWLPAVEAGIQGSVIKKNMGKHLVSVIEDVFNGLEAHIEVIEILKSPGQIGSTEKG